MAEDLSVSRVPLREAMRLLADQGLLQYRRNQRNQRYFVTKRPPAEREQINWMLHLLENKLMTSIVRPDAAVLDALRELIAEMAIRWAPPICGT